MQGTQKLRPVEAVGHGRVPTPLLLAVVLVAAGLAYVSLLAQPALVRAMSELLGGVPSAARGPAWLVPLVAASLAVAGASVCMLVLSAFIRGVQAAPYVWLAPLLVGFCGLVLGHMRIDLPLAYVSPEVFAGIAGLLMLGAGALLQMRGVTAKICGSLMLALPFLTVVGGYAHAAGGFEPAYRALDSASVLFLFVLLAMAVGVALVALVARVAPSAAVVAHGSRLSDAQLDQLRRALARAREFEQRAVEAERRAELAEISLRVQGAVLHAPPGMASRPDETAEFVALARPGVSRTSVVIAGVCVLACALLGLYFAAYRPLARRASAQQALLAESAREHAAEIERLHKRIEAERATLHATLAAQTEKLEQAEANARHERPPSAPAEAPAAAPTAPAPAVAQPPAAALRANAQKSVKGAGAQHAAAEPAAAPATPAELPAVRMVAHKAQRAPAPRSASGARRKLPVKPSAAAAAAKAPAPAAQTDEKSTGLKESYNDDPIGGLDGM